MNNLLGIPAHPLLVHLPVVGIPVLAMLTAVILFKPRWRDSMVVPTAIFAVVLAAGTIIAANAGESLQARVPDTALVRTHAELGDQLKVITVVFAGLLLAYASLSRLREHDVVRRLAPLLPVFLVAAVTVGAIATVWDVRAGHAGAKAVWRETPQAQVPDKSSP